ncbi:gliding motility-associated C-terminal domain-containing protein [Hymenobacter sp. BT770]|uniref:T9SS type B sorting domain-containing protein n=1 Tax=Hymenobacter sp. BT770 TaxID=2886942 RepID=UPI001D126071|nr:gliding motility-associated C-terminal domain-containing protein [Hymenobacter sp. BT770]MCC3152143.1 gliding motility-associated C-terminal domain-containing protein [Hymenobacter sp. BT770]MDO3415175.1 gliding motility-associated C-terminal domain-containing protein [Hymenobacter sp. BT770]
MPAELSHLAQPSTSASSLHASEPGQPAGLVRRSPAGRVRPALGWLLTLLLLLLSGAATSALAQGTPPPECAADEKFANTWYFGFKAGLDFNQASADSLPKVLTNGAMDAPAGSGVMSDKDGKILFYSNGETVWNGDGTVMTNGTGLAGNRFTTDGPLPIRKPGITQPGQPTRYLLFTLNSTVGLSYSEIEIPAGGGPGTVIDSTKNKPLARGTAEKLTGVFHKNGCDIWVITHGWGDAKTGNDNRGDAFLAYRVTVAGVQPVPIITPVGSLHAASKSPVGFKGQMKVTPDGQRLALARYSEAVGDSSSTVELFGFDTGSGQVSVNPQVPYIVDSGAGKYYGVGFSPGSYLYATVRNPPKLLQFDISGKGPVTKQDIPLKTAADLGSLQAAPDGKIYVARDNQPALGFIAYPDSVAAKVGYAEDSLKLGGRLSGLGLVNFNQSSLLRVGPSAQITGCRQIAFKAPPIDFDKKVYAWTFGDGATSADENPVHVYATPGNYTVTLRITTECFCRESSGLIQVPDLPKPGSIAAPQTLCAGQAPALLTSATNASGDAGLPLVYQWESSTDNATFTAIGGATGPTYQPAATLPAGTTYFRRSVQLLLPDRSGPYCTSTQTASVAITVLPALTAGTIAADQTVCAGTTPAPLTSTAPATGGTGTFAYQWEASTDNITWTAISGATNDAFTPGPLSATTFFRRQVRSGTCTAPPSNVVTLTVVPALTAGSIGTSQTVCTGSSATPLTNETPATGGAGTIAYQWESSADNVNWTPIAGATGPTYAPGQLNATTYFRRRASSGNGCAPVLSNVVAITVLPTLTAGTIGADQTLCPGATPTPLTSTAGASGGSGSFSYQWESSPNNSSWTPIAGATSSTFAPGLLTATTYFRRSVTSGVCGPEYTPSVTLTVLPVLTAGSIAADQTICAGDTPASLTSATAPSGGTGKFVYQWESSPDNTTFTAIGVATSADYAPGPLAATTYFRRQVTSGTCGPEISAPVKVTVLPAVTAGSVAADQIVCPGVAPAPLSSTALASGGTGAFAYQWEASADNTNWSAIGGATSPTFAPGPLTATTYFRRRVTSGTCGPFSSNVVAITVLPALTAGTIAADQAICIGATPAPLSSTAGAGGGTGSFSYQWESSPNNSSWTAIPGATSPTFAPGPLSATTYFRRRVTSGLCGPEYSPSVAITVLPALTAGSIAANQDVCAGASPAPLTSTAGAGGGTGTFVYQWEASADSTNWGAISGATSPTFAPGPLSATTFFRRRVTSGTGTCSTQVSNAVAVRVQPIVTTGVTLAAPPVQCAGTALTFTAVPTNAGTAPTFRWLVNNVAVASGPTFTSSTLATGDVVRVELTPTVGLCSTGPAAASVTVTRTPTPLPTLAIAVQPGGPVCPGEPLTFSITSITEAGTGPTYQWQVNGNDVAGATNPVFTSTTLRDGQTVTLRLRTTNVCGQPVTAVSNGVAARILPPVDVDAGPDKEILAGTSVVLDGSADGNYPVTWTPTVGLSFPGNDRLHPIASPTVTTTYTITGGTGGCADSDQVTVTVRPPIRIPNAFTPNGDGRDDTWQIEFIEQFPDNTVSVFNRWGNRIFSANNYSRANEWRGDINGQPAPVGTYYYVVVTKGPLGRSYSGSITILY